MRERSQDVLAGQVAAFLGDSLASGLPPLLKCLDHLVVAQLWLPRYLT